MKQILKQNQVYLVQYLIQGAKFFLSPHSFTWGCKGQNFRKCQTVNNSRSMKSEKNLIFLTCIQLLYFSKGAKIGPCPKFNSKKVKKKKKKERKPSFYHSFQTLNFPHWSNCCCQILITPFRQSIYLFPGIFTLSSIIIAAIYILFCSLDLYLTVYLGDSSTSVQSHLTIFNELHRFIELMQLILQIIC